MYAHTFQLCTDRKSVLLFYFVVLFVTFDVCTVLQKQYEDGFFSDQAGGLSAWQRL
jgi:hypothetical protein